MGTVSAPAPPPVPAGPATFRRLQPRGEPATAMQIAGELEEAARTAPAGRGRPYVMLNMISTADGRASLGGRSGPLSDQADRELFHALRAVVDAVMVGAGTARAERYGPIIRDADVRRRRGERGLAEQPLACLVSGRLALPEDLPLLASAGSRVAIITSSQASVPGARATVEYVRAQRDGKVDLASALEELQHRFAVRLLLCEGGPHLNSHLLAAGLVDELLLTLSPKLAGGDPTTGEALRIVAGPERDANVQLELAGLLASDSQLFLRYGVRA
jgi:riboflavin-specific deaminase-like protein